MTQIQKTLICTLLIATLGYFVNVSSGREPVRAFTTGGHTVYHLRTARMDQDESRVLIAAALDGMVMCFTCDGDLLWENQVSNSLPLDLDVADIDGDGRDETLVASADGGLYVLDPTGELKWRFSRQPPLIQVCAVTGTERGTVILAGGVEKKLYALSANGDEIGVFESPFAVRHVRSGDFFGDGKKHAAVVTAKNDRSRFFLQLFDPVDLKPTWGKPVGLATGNPTEGTKFHVPWLAYRVAVFSMLPCCPWTSIRMASRKSCWRTISRNAECSTRMTTAARRS